MTLNLAHVPINCCQEHQHVRILADLSQVDARAVVQSMEECGDTEHGIHPRGHVIPQPIVVLCVLDGGNEHDTLPGVQVQVDLQHRRPGLPGNLIRIQVCCHVTQAHQHHLPQSCDDDVADKVHVGLPVRQPL